MFEKCFQVFVDSPKWIVNQLEMTNPAKWISPHIFNGNSHTSEMIETAEIYFRKISDWELTIFVPCLTSMLQYIFGRMHLWCNESLVSCIYDAMHLWCAESLVRCIIVVLQLWCDVNFVIYIFIATFLGCNISLV